MIWSTLCYIEKDDKYLMLHRTKKKEDINAGKWIGVGGKVEPLETVPECLLREVREETGLRLLNYQVRGIIVFNSDWTESETMFLYTADEFEKLEEIFCDEGDLKWIPKDEVLGLNLWEGDRVFVRKLLEGDPFFFMRMEYEGEEMVECVTEAETFKDKVYQEVARIPYGHTMAYGEIAMAIGHPGAARAVGNVLHENPYEGVIPCHRVVNARGMCTENFCFGGREVQANLLRKEGVTVVDGRVIAEKP